MGVSSSEPSQQSSPCTDSSFLLALLPLLLLSCLMLAMPDMQALLPLTHMLPTELPQLPMLVLPMLPQWLPLSSRLLSPSSSGDTRLLIKQLIQAFEKRKQQKKEHQSYNTSMHW